MAAACGDARNLTRLATSSGCMMRLIGTSPIAWRRNSSTLTPVILAPACMPCAAISVSTHPGQIALTVMRRSTSSSASARVKPMTACFDAQYAVYPGTPNRPSTEDTFTTRPPSASSGTDCRVTRKVPQTLVSRIRRQLAVAVLCSGSPPPMPALFTSTSSRAPIVRSSAKPAATADSSATSIGSSSASAPRSRMAAAVSSSCARVRAAMATREPGSANANAIARPIPRPPPVTRIVGMLLLHPVAGVLLEEGQRLERLHPVDEQDAVEVIGFMLDDARGEAVRADLEARAFAIVRPHGDLAGARDASADVGNAEAAFPVLDDLRARHGCDIRVDERDRLDVRHILTAVVRVERGDEQTHAFVHLRRRQPD